MTISNLSIRLTQARRAAGLSFRALGSLVGLSHAAIKKYEDSLVYPSSDILIKLAKALNVRVDLFFRPIKVSLAEVKFRKRKKLSKKSEEKIKFEVMGQIERRLELENLYPNPPMTLFQLPLNLPKKIEHLDELEDLAEQLRDYWELGLAPIHDLIDALENRGIRVFIVNIDDKHFDGLSTVIDNQPMIVTSSKWSGCRQRFNILHEFAHYVLANRLDDKLDEEQACNRFAASFLFPKIQVFQNLGKKRSAIEWQELISLREQFQLSMGAICYRLRDLAIISEPYFKSLMIRFRQKGWHLQEPGHEILPEKNHAFTQMLFHALGEHYIGESKAAELLSCSLHQLKALRQVNATINK